MNSKLKLNSLKTLFIFIPCIIPAKLLEGGTVKLFFNSWRIIAFFIMVFYLFRSKQKASKILVHCSVFSGIIIISTFLNRGEINSSISIAMMMFTIIGLSEIQIQKNPAMYFKIIGMVSWVILLIDTLQIFTEIGFGPLDNSTWLGGDNFAIFTVLPMLGIIVLSDGLNYKRVRNITVMFCMFVVMAKFKTFAVTSILAFFVLGIGICLESHIAMSKRVKRSIAVIIALLLAFLCINFSDIYMQFATLFGKEPYIEHSRLAIWNLSIKAILNKPLIGHGVLGAYKETIVIAGKYWATCSHTHNYILELLFRGGIIGTIAYMLMFKDYFRVAIQKQNNKLVMLLKVFLIANLVLWITESYYAQAPVYVLLVLASHTELLKNYELTSTKHKLIFK